jgi:hypothetical protein
MVADGDILYRRFFKSYIGHRARYNFAKKSNLLAQYCPKIKEKENYAALNKIFMHN